jgi:hypothetical protein
MGHNQHKTVAQYSANFWSTRNHGANRDQQIESAGVELSNFTAPEAWIGTPWRIASTAYLLRLRLLAPTTLDTKYYGIGTQHWCKMTSGSRSRLIPRRRVTWLCVVIGQRDVTAEGYRCLAAAYNTQLEQQTSSDTGDEKHEFMPSCQYYHFY